MFNKPFYKIAYSNLWRRRSRTILVITMISFGLAAMIYSQGMYDGMMVQMVNDQIRTGSGELAIYKDTYEENKLLSTNIKDPEIIHDWLKHNGQIKHFVSRLRSDGVISSAKYSQTASVIGLDTRGEENFINYKDALLRGKFALEKNRKQVIIGERLAEKLKVDIGKKVVIQGQSLDKEIIAEVLRVTGIIKTNNPLLDNSGVLIDKTVFAELFRINGVTEFSVLLNDSRDIDLRKNEFEKALAEISDEKLEVFSWRELYPIVLLWDKAMKYFIYISYAIVFLVVALGIFFILFISIMERLKEFGILLALGTSFKTIAKIVFLEAIFMGVFGYLLGSSLGWMSLQLTDIWGLDLSYFSSGLNDIGMAAIMYPDIRGEYFVLAFWAVFLSSIASALIPLWKLKKLKAVEAIRFI